MLYKNTLYKLASLMSPNFYKEISDLISFNGENLTIFDIGFYKGEFTKRLIENLDIDTNKQNIFVYSFDPNNKISRKEFKEFSELKNIHWRHFSDAIGDKNSKEKFTILKHFPSSGSSINNILVDSKWIKTRRIIFSPLSKKDNIAETIEVNQITLDSLNLDIKCLDILKIDVEGYAYKVLKGAKETIDKFNPIIQLEILSKKNEYAESREKIIEFLLDLDYKLIETKQHSTTHFFSDVICVDLLFIKF